MRNILFLSSLVLLGACSQREATTVVLDKSEVAPNFWTASIAKNISPERFPSIASEICGGVEKCMVGLWYEDRPEGLPFEESALRGQLFAYTKNSQTGFYAESWNCEKFKQYKGKTCLPAG